MRKYIKIVLGLASLMAMLIVGASIGFYIGISLEKPAPPKYNYSLWNNIQSNNGKSIDFQTLGSHEWNKVCFLGPYNTNSEKLLGFNWNISEYTDVLSSDGYNVIIFTNDKEVIDFVVQTRSHGDFQKMSGKCLPRNNSKLFLSDKSRSFMQDES